MPLLAGCRFVNALPANRAGLLPPRSGCRPRPRVEIVHSHTGLRSARTARAKARPAEVPRFLSFKSIKPFINKHLGDLQSIVVNYRTERGSLARGIRAEINT